MPKVTENEGCLPQEPGFNPWILVPKMSLCSYSPFHSRYSKLTKKRVLGILELKVILAHILFPFLLYQRQDQRGPEASGKSHSKLLMENKGQAPPAKFPLVHFPATESSLGKPPARPV